jgi:16S rRNA (cytidine1402-2'-O)-methyltransferase
MRNANVGTMGKPRVSSKGVSRAPRGDEGGVGTGEPSPGIAESQSGLEPGLYVTATPIGNARDITLRALSVLANCDVIAAEDTRVTAKLLAIHGISKPLSAYNDHNAARERPRLLARLRAGARVALVSDAGTPLVSDPGYKLVRDALAAEISVDVLPGASAPLAALVLSGLPTDRFLFAGFLPPRSGERQSALADLRSAPASLVFFESPRRLSESLRDMAQILGVRNAAVGRELTKLHQEVKRGNLFELATAYAGAEPPRGEVTIIVGPPLDAEPDRARVESLLKKALAFMPVRAAADLVAEAMDVPRRGVYEQALELKAAAND